MNKLAYDLALLCVEHGLRTTKPESWKESSDFAFETFKCVYERIADSGEPLLQSFVSSGCKDSFQ